MSGDGDEMCSIKVNKFLNKVDILNEKHKLYVKVKKKKKEKDNEPRNNIPFTPVLNSHSLSVTIIRNMEG